MDKISLSKNQMLLAVFLGIIILIGAQALALMIGNLPVMLGLPVAAGNVLAGLCYPILTWAGVSVLCKKVLKLSLADCRITKFQIKPVWVIASFAMPAIVSVVLIVTPGHWEINFMDTAEKWAVITGSVFFFGLATGIVEEMIFRGVIMSALEYCFNKWVAVLVPSVLFGLLHIIGNNLDFLGTIQLLAAGSMVGILFSLVTYESGSIFSSALMHGVWNMVMVGGILNIGREADKASVFNYVLDSNSFLITGGDFGVEASVVSVMVYLIFAVIAVHYNRNKK